MTFLLARATDPAIADRDRVLELLATRAGDTDDPEFRAALAAALPGLVGLVDDPDPRVRLGAVAVLRELGGCAGEIVPALRARYARERTPDVRLALVLAVGYLVGDASGAPHRRGAVGWLRRRRLAADPALRLAATAMVWRAGVARPADMSVLLDTLGAVDPAALDGVAVLTGERMTDWLAGELGADRDARTAVATRLFDAPAGAGTDALRVAAAVLATWRSPAATLMPAVAARLDHRDPQMRACAAHVVASAARPSEAHADALAAALADPAARVADLAAWGLSRMDDPRCLPRLRNRALIGTSVFDVVQAYHPRGVVVFSAPGLLDVLGPLAGWADELLPRVRSALSDADSFHQRRVLADVLARWGPAGAPAVPELSRLLNTDAAAHACRAFGAIGPAAATAAHRLSRLVERDPSSRLRAVAAWAHFRVSGDPDVAARVLGDALYGELAAPVLPLLADLGPLAAGHAGRVRELAKADSDWHRTEAARALWLLTGEPAESWTLLHAVLQPLAHGRTTPVTRRALAVLATLPQVPPEIAPLLREVVDGDRRYGYYGDWRAIPDDDELRGLAATALTRISG